MKFYGIFPSAMVLGLDRSVGKVMTALKDADMLENSIVIYFSDNGALTLGQRNNQGANAPLRGVSCQSFYF